MPIPSKIKNFLEKNKIKYEPIEHRIVYTAFDKAATLKVPEKIVGKTLVVKLDRSYALVLIPANRNLDKGKLKKVAKVKNVDFVKEAWMKKDLKGVKIGAIPPFGNLWRLPTFIDRSLIHLPLAPKAPPRRVAIIVNGGDYNWSIKFNPANFKRIVPDLIIGNFSRKK